MGGLHEIMAPDLLARFAEIVGERFALTGQAGLEPYLEDVRRHYRGRTTMVLRPGSTEEVAAVMSLANETRTPIVPQGGNTGLVGGQIPASGEIVLSLTRLDKIREVDPTSGTLTVESGVTLQRARAAAAASGYLYPQLLPSEGTCTIGGNLATNAGGVAAVQHGVARSHVLGLEVVLADGRTLRNLSKLKKDNTGYDLNNLFVGSEGTLGIITAAVMRMVPAPQTVQTAFIALDSVDAVLSLLTLAQGRVANMIASFEIMNRAGLEAVLGHFPNLRHPLTAPAPWYVLAEFSSWLPDSSELIQKLLENAIVGGLITDATLSQSTEQTRQFWAIRDSFGDALRRSGGALDHDVSVPVAVVPQFIREANDAVTALVPGCRPVPFGHAGDGNIHYAVLGPLSDSREAFFARKDDVRALVFGIVRRLQGSISAEHGIGVMKRDLLPSYKDPVALDLMRTLKAMFDPNNILNPNKVI